MEALSKHHPKKLSKSVLKRGASPWSGVHLHGAMKGIFMKKRTTYMALWRGDLWKSGPPHIFSVQQSRVYSLVAPCRLPDLTSLALLGSVSGQPGLSRGPLPGYKTVSKWRLQLQDSTPFLLLSQRFCTSLHTSASLGCYLLFTHMPDWHLLVKYDSGNLCFVRL